VEMCRRMSNSIPESLSFDEMESLSLYSIQVVLFKIEQTDGGVKSIKLCVRHDERSRMIDD